MNKEHMPEQPIPKEEASGAGCDAMSPVIPQQEQQGALDAQTPIKREADDDLPLAASSLPPRKRAKTKDEKEQRRVERIMRNRQAAHASREKKRKHLEDLEQKCESLTRTNADLDLQLQRAQRLQVESQEKQMTLQTRVNQLESALQMAKQSGDLSFLENLAVETVPAAKDPLPSECTSPGNLQLLSIPSLSNSVGNSPAYIDESDDYEPLDPFSAFPTDLAVNESSSKTHHPAVMMS